MKKIALIMESWKRYFTFAWPAGILQRIHETNEDVNLYIFNSSDGWTRDDDYKIGEYNIFRLPNLKDFDGVILDLNNIGSRSVHNEVIQTARDSGVPVISIANEIDGFYYVGINNYKAMTTMIVHLHKEHHCRDFWFIMGPSDNFESSSRTAAMKDYMERHDIPYSDDNFYFESFEYQTGVNGFEALLKLHGKLPDAVICCNDNIAVGVCEAAEAHNYMVPGDFLVTGFDNFDKASYYMPSISTIGHIREEAGYLCADTFLRLWAGETVPRYLYTKTEAIFQESCGCKNPVALDARRHLKGQIMYGIETNEFDEDVLSLDYELMKCNSVADMIKCIPQCIPSMKCDAMYLVLDRRMNSFTEQSDFNRHTDFMSDEAYHMVGYPEKMMIRFAYENGHTTELTDTEIENIFPTFDYPEGGKDFLFLPLHFRSRTVGYFVIRNAVYLMEKQYLFQVMKALTTAMENLHKKEMLEYMNHILSRLSIRDALTGLYNRLGHQKLSEDFIRKMHTKNCPVLILFIDLDRLKYINDNFGHACGDFAITAVSDAIVRCSSVDSIPARTGGDEFILVTEAPAQEEINAMILAIRNDIHDSGVRSDFPAELSVSVGVAVTDPASPKTLDEYVKEADSMMYEEKLLKKVNRKN